MKQLVNLRSNNRTRAGRNRVSPSPRIEKCMAFPKRREEKRRSGSLRNC